MGMVTQPREQHHRLAKVRHCLAVEVAPTEHVAQVQTDPRRRAAVAQRQQFALGHLAAGGGLVVPTEHRQGHDLRHLGLRGRVRLAGLAQPGGGPVKAGHRVGQAALGDLGDAAGPVGEGLDLGLSANLPWRRLRGQRTQQLGRSDRTGGCGVPGVVAQGFQCPGQGESADSVQVGRQWRFVVEQAARQPGGHSAGIVGV